jgi:hypothetical protein
VPKLRIKNNYFAICCQNGKGTMVVAKWVENGSSIR